MDEEDTVRLVRERAKRSYDAQPLKNTLHVHTIDLTYCYGDTDVIGFKYDEADKLFVFFLVDEECEPPCHYSCHTFSYDLNEKTITEVECPIMPLEAKDFLDGLLLLDYTADQLSEMKPVEDCDEFRFMRGTENADLLVQAVWLDESLKHRANILAFDWNGHEFVRKAEADVSGVRISKNGFFDLKQWSKIPDSLSDFNVERKTFLVDDDEAIRYVYTKGDELVMEIEPDFDNNGYTDNVGVIMIYSERYLTFDGFHVGSLINDVINYYGEDVYAYTIEDGLLAVDAAGLQFVLEREDYEGELPEENQRACVPIDPTFKPDATVKSIRVYLWEL